MNSTMPHLTTKADLKEEVGKLDKKIEKGQKESRTWLLTATVSIIGVMIAIASFFGIRDTNVVYVPQSPSQQSIAPSVGTISALNELRNIVMELKQATATKAEQEQASLHPSD